MARRTLAARRRARIIWLAVLLLAVLAGLFGWRWLNAHPQHNPWAPLSLSHPIGMATGGKLAALYADPPACRALLTEAGVNFGTLPSIGANNNGGACALTDRTSLTGLAVTPLQVPLRPREVASTCAVAAALTLWLRDGVQPAAQTHLGQRVVALTHLGTVNCRRIGGGTDGTWSEHASGNAIDISGFILADGSRVTLLDHWDATNGRSAFLRAARDAACDLYATTLSPDYNRAHADHFHLDMASRMGSVCR